ncbi:MAG TPA: Flp pilus assembly protein CpaB [Anaerolineaceae bacterium]|nr:Flp pilus assembly protein CpaB [Anaerolineaceae bacterium]
MATTKKRSGRTFLYILIILIAVALLGYLYLSRSGGGQGNQPAATATPPYELVQIVVASQSIPRGQIITAEVLTTIQYPKSELVEGTFFTSVTDAVGAKAKFNIDPGVPLTTSMVLHAGTGSLAANDIPAGMTAFSIAISPETAVAYAPQSGDHVMVIACLLVTDVDTNYQTRLPNDTTVVVRAGFGTPESGITESMVISPYVPGVESSRGRFELDSTTNEPVYIVPSEIQRPRLVCQTVMQDVTILNVGLFPLESEAVVATLATLTPVVATEQAPTTGPEYPGSVTLIVSPQDNLILNYLSLSGAKLSLALRSAGDTQTFTTDPVTLQYIMDTKNIPAPAKIPYSIEPRLDTLTYPSFNSYILTQP